MFNCHSAAVIVHRYAIDYLVISVVSNYLRHTAWPIAIQHSLYKYFWPLHTVKEGTGECVVSVFQCCPHWAGYKITSDNPCLGPIGSASRTVMSTVLHRVVVAVTAGIVFFKYPVKGIMSPVMQRG